MMGVREGGREGGRGKNGGEDEGAKGRGELWHGKKEELWNEARQKKIGAK